MGLLFLTWGIFLLGLCAPAGAAVYHVAQRHPQASDQNLGTAERPWKTISHAAQVLQPGDTVIVHGGVYREHVRPARGGKPEAPITYQAAPGEEVIITGADLVTEWQRVPGEKPIWAHRPWPYKFPVHGAPPPVGRCEQVIVDGKLLRPVLTREEMSPGTFCADTEVQVLYLWLADGSDPRQHTVEASVRNRCFGFQWKQPGVDYLVVRGFVMRYGANMAQRGLLYCVGNHWLIENNVIEWANGNGLSFRGEGHVLRGNICRYNGQMGLGGGGRDILLENLQLLYNNQKGFPAGWEAGGMKITHSRRGKVIGLYAIGNRGPGLWFDIDVRDFEVSRCYVRDNFNSGIFVEISGGFHLHDNLCVGNGGANWADAGICLAESNDCLVEHNLCLGNKTGIGLREQGPRTFRGFEGQEVTYWVRNVTLRRNICAFNRDFQFGLWSDNVFFGPHPSPQVGNQGTPLNPAEQHYLLEENLYFAAEGQGLILWGVPWRKKHETFAALADFTQAHGQEAHSLVADPRLMDWKGGDYRLRPDSPALVRGMGLQEPPVGLREIVGRE